MAIDERFDEAYFQRHYHDPKTRVTDERAIRKLGRFVFSYAAYLGFVVDRVVEFGAGVGHFQQATRVLQPKAEYEGIEVSDYLCEEYGYTKGSVVDAKPKGGKGDVVVCQGVLQYLADADAKKAIANLAKHCEGVVYIEALTQEDWEQNCDQTRTDGEVHLRPAAWYRDVLRERFVSCGGGVFVPRSIEVVLYELERGME